MTSPHVRVEFNDDAVKNAVKKGGVKSLRRVGAYVRKSARNAVSRANYASPAGRPPHTRRGLLKRALLFGVEKQRMSVVIGPAKSLMGLSMTPHEFGGMYRRRKYPKRPLMGPTLVKVAPQLPKLWKECVKT